jgi:hypothetical protein
MRRLVPLLFFFIACHRSDANAEGSTTAAAGDRVDVLFIGNSYTFVNDLPAMTTKLVASATPPLSLHAESVTAGGATLRSLWEKTDAQARIANGHWRYVVLQGQSVEPCVDRAGYVAYAQRFAKLAVVHGATPVLYATWPRHAENDFYADTHSPRTPREMASCLRDGATAAAAGVTMTIADVRDPWMKALSERPALQLYAPDGSHPSAAGTYLAATVFARAFGASNGSWHPAEVTDADAAYLAGLR